MPHKITKPSRAAISFWAVDSLLYLLNCRDQGTTEELLARAASFVDAYIMFDQMVLPERYKTKPELLALAGSDEPFEFFDPATIIHSSDLRSGVTIDLNFDVVAFEDLLKEDAAWYVQHTGRLNEDDFWVLMAEAKKRSASDIRPAHLRLWQWGLMNELCDKFDAVALPIPSLNGVEKVLPARDKTAHFVYEKYSGLDEYFRDTRTIVSRYSLPPKDHALTACPPLFAILLERSRNQDEVVDNLRRMRNDFRELRDTQKTFMALLAAASGVREQAEVIKEWNSSWDILLRSDFRKPSLLRRAVTTSEIAKSIAEAGAGKPPALSMLVEKYLNYHAEMKVHKRFRIFSDLAAQLDSLVGTRDKLELLFGIQKVVVAPRPLS